MIQSLLSNFAILFFMHIIIEQLETMRKDHNHHFINAMIIFVLSASSIAMFYLPIYFGEYYFDLRVIPLIFSAILRPYYFTMTALGIATVYRALLGGVGAFPGILFGMVLPTLFTMVMIHFVPLSKVQFKRILQTVGISTVAWMISDVPAIFMIPNGLEIFKQMMGPRYIAFIIATIILFYLIDNSRKRRYMEQRLQYESTHDQLTGVWNKKTLLEHICERLDGKATAFLAMLDLDYFKQINDQYGHLTGDKVLRELAQQLQNYQTDLYSKVARYGGEEFIMYIEANSLQEAVTYLQSVCEHVRHYEFRSVQGERICGITMSIGISQIESVDTLQRDLERADRYLYEAKKAGRNQIVFC